MLVAENQRFGWRTIKRARISGMKRSKIHIAGASGSGTTTLGRALANYWSVPHADTDDYFWLPTDPPYVTTRAKHERLNLMQSVFVPREAWVLSGSLLGWGEPVIEQCDAVIFLTLESEERIRRLEKREDIRRSGSRFDEVAWNRFLQWAKGYDNATFEGRNLAGHERWLGKLDKPVLRLDSAMPPEQLVDAIKTWEPSF